MYRIGLTHNNIIHSPSLPAFPLLLTKPASHLNGVITHHCHLSHHCTQPTTSQFETVTEGIRYIFYLEGGHTRSQENVQLTPTHHPLTHTGTHRGAGVAVNAWGSWGGWKGLLGHAYTHITYGAIKARLSRITPIVTTREGGRCSCPPSSLPSFTMKQIRTNVPGGSLTTTYCRHSMKKGHTVLPHTIPIHTLGAHHTTLNSNTLPHTHPPTPPHITHSGKNNVQGVKPACKDKVCPPGRRKVHSLTGTRGNGYSWRLLTSPASTPIAFQLKNITFQTNNGNNNGWKVYRVNSLREGQ